MINCIGRSLKNINILTQKRNQHSGSYPYSIVSALIPQGVDGICHYESAVGGNEPQKQQHSNGQNTYHINSLRQAQKEVINEWRSAGVSVRARETAHMQPLKSALFSLNGMLPDQLILNTYNDILKLAVLDENGRLINNFFTKEILKRYLKDDCRIKSYQNILEKAFDGIFSGYADNIYIANDYLLTRDGKYGYMAKYPTKAIQRSTEYAHNVASLLKDGIMPIPIQEYFEGVANLKVLPMIFKIDGDDHQLALSYESSRAELNYLKEVNHWQKKLGLPQYHAIKLMPNSRFRNHYYHQDCAINFL